MFVLFLIVATFFGTCFLGHLVHWAAHQEWSGPFYRTHHFHHFNLYPPHDMYSEKYRSAKTNSSTIWFPIAFSPILISLIAAMIVGWISWTAGLTVLITAIVVGILHSEIHDATHLYSTWFRLIPGFNRWCDLHLRHHQNTQANFGIFFFGFDRLFGTFEEPMKE